MFARKLYEELQIPIGIIEAACGGTKIETWLPKDSIGKYPDLKIPDKVPEGGDRNKRPILLYNAMIHPFQNFNIKGVLWYQGE